MHSSPNTPACYSPLEYSICWKLIIWMPKYSCIVSVCWPNFPLWIKQAWLGKLPKSNDVTHTKANLWYGSLMLSELHYVLHAMLWLEYRDFSDYITGTGTYFHLTSLPRVLQMERQRALGLAESKLQAVFDNQTSLLPPSQSLWSLLASESHLEQFLSELVITLRVPMPSASLLFDIFQWNTDTSICI